ncbi:MAG: uroporphyrinogen-III synthase [Gammaproteobacteria bacterium]|nr:uroporphyrinogen-III synthase [Gammaproteobacteria bacterium]NNL06146.1 uroporphyrinogen-III synthase [Gammaproteobacteria bacterium]
MHQSGRPLHNVKVLVTRPKQRAAGLCESIGRAGGTALPFAAIEIKEPDDPQSRENARAHIGEFALAIFISPTAVEQTVDYIGKLPSSVSIAAIGSRTAQTLKAQDMPVDIEPDGHDSESLLQHPLLQQNQVQGKKIIIFRGEGGREILEKTLTSRGAEVFYADMYQRSPPSSPGQLEHYLAQTDIITISSNQGLQNLFDLVTDKHSITRHCLVVPGERAFRLAKALGFGNIVVAENATDEACMNALKYAASKMSKNS